MDNFRFFLRVNFAGPKWSVKPLISIGHSRSERSSTAESDA